ncbi:MAG: FliM/FliN family flagellar motor switch protein [Deltaproteobacteria bacterium]|nr:FliM/FliN family flagellar motor switch protein [Deltaproteobacteria bacterium]
MTAAATPRATPASVDITGAERRFESRAVTLQRVVEAFARVARRSLPFLGRRRLRLVAGRVGAAELLAVRDGGGPICQVTLELTGRRGALLFRVDAGAMAAIVEGTMGAAAPEGDGPPVTEPLTALSLAQRALVARVARALSADLAEVFRDLGLGEVKVLKIDALRPGEAPTVPRSPVAAECRLDGGTGSAGFLIAAAGELLDASTRERAPEPPAGGDPAFALALADVPLDVVAELGRVTLGLRRVLSLRPGEVLRLSTAIDDPVEVRVGGIPKLDGSPVLSRGQVAIQVSRRHGD